jgi:hypothetical protein
MQTILTNTLETWASLYANHSAIRTMIGFMHIGGLVGGGGCAIAADRITLMNANQKPSVRMMQLESLRNSHRVVILGLILVMLSGVLLFAADVDTFIYSKLFWVKMALIAMLLVNGSLLVRVEHRAERGEERAWKRLVVASTASILLWFLTTLAGAALLNNG